MMGDIILILEMFLLQSFFCHPLKSREPSNLQTEMSKADSQLDELPAVIKMM